MNRVARVFLHKPTSPANRIGVKLIRIKVFVEPGGDLRLAQQKTHMPGRQFVHVDAVSSCKTSDLSKFS